MKIMRIITRLNVGGPAIHATLLDRELEGEGIQSLLITGNVGHQEGDMSYLLSGGKMPIVLPELKRELHPVQDILCLWKLFQLMRRERPDIVHTHTAKAGTLGRIAATFAGVPVKVHTFHGHVFQGYFRSFTSRFFVAIERFLAKRSDCLVAVSDHVREEICGRYGLASKERVRVIPVGLDLTSFLRVNGRGDRLRSELGLSPEIQLIGMVGRLVPIKNHPFFLRAVEVLVQKNRNLHCVIVGGGEEETVLKRMVKEKGISSFVTFLGWRKDLADIYSDLDLVVLTSLNEGTPVSLIEAMASGKAVVATSVGGVPDVVGEGVTGDLVGTERVRLAIEKFPFVGRGVTISIGVGSFPGDGSTVQELLEAADRRLYQAKRLGCNRVVGPGGR